MTVIKAQQWQALRNARICVLIIFLINFLFLSKIDQIYFVEKYSILTDSEETQLAW